MPALLNVTINPELAVHIVQNLFCYTFYYLCFTTNARITREQLHRPIGMGMVCSSLLQMLQFAKNHSILYGY